MVTINRMHDSFFLNSKLLFLRHSDAVDVQTTGLHGAGHAVETMDAISQAPSLPVKIYLDEIDKLGNYESIFP